MPKKRKFFAGEPPEKGKRVQDRHATTGADPDTDFVRLVKERRYPEALEIIDQVENINITDPQTGATALHFAALRACTGLIGALEGRGDLNYLVQDNAGRYPSELAWEIGGHEELGARLIQKEKEQAQRTGVDAWPKPRPPEAV